MFVDSNFYIYSQQKQIVEELPLRKLPNRVLCIYGKEEVGNCISVMPDDFAFKLRDVNISL